MATRTDLGKIMLTNGGEYDPDAVYDAKTFVLWRGSTYLALQTVTGVEPVDDRVNWQLLAQGFAGSEFEIEGYVYVENEEIIEPFGEPLLNADKLGGNLPEYYAPQNEISDAFLESKSYAVGDYCIYLNALYRFTKAKAAGAWDGTAVVPVTLAQEIKANKSAIGANTSAIDVLNGNTYALSGGIPIPEGADLNSYKTSGNYYCEMDVIAETLKNSPTKGRAFIMKLEQATGVNAYPSQTIVVYNSGKRYYRLFDRDLNQWYDWTEYVTNSDLEVSTYAISQPTTNSIFTRFGSWYCNVLKSGHLVVLQININGDVSATDDVETLFTLPQGYRPKYDIPINYISQSGKRMLIFIAVNGDVRISNFETALSNEWYCRQCITYTNT